MTELWIILGVIVVFVLGAALPLLKDREESKIVKKETLKSFRDPN